MPLARFVTTVLITATLASIVNAKAQPSDAIPFSLDQNGGIVVPVLLGEEGPFAFLLDTGSNGSAITESLASRLKAPIVARTTLTTSTGSEVRLVTHIDRMTLGPRTMNDLLPVVVPDPTLAKLKVSGIIGQDFLGTLSYTLDYRRRRLSWDAPSATTAGVTRLKMIWTQGRFLVELPQPGATASVLRFLPDTGSEGIVLFARPGGPRLDVEPASENTQLTSLTGARDVERAVIRLLQVGHVTWRQESVVVVRRWAHDAPQSDGLLPLHRFSRVSFNGREGYLTVE
jgi:hypothetical protein